MKIFAPINDKKVIFITESQAMSLLFEAASIQDIYQKYYSNIPQDIFQEIVSYDPTYNPDKPDKMGKYGKWLLAIYQKGNLKTEDLYKAREYLSTFMRYNGKIEQRDIMKYGSLQDLYNVIQPFLDNPQQAATKSEEVRKIKEGAEKVYEDEKWLVIVPHTQEASCYYGKGTQWCTAADSAYNYFDNYNKEGFLYINILKGTDTKYQFHFETHSFMDATDSEIDQPIAETIGLTEGLINFYISKYGKLAAIPFNTGFNFDDMIEIKGLDGYFVNDEQTYLYRIDENDYSVETVLDVFDEEYSISDYSVRNRFIPLWKGDYTVNLYDVVNDEMVFNENDGVSCFEMYKSNLDYLIVYFNYGQEDEHKGIFSLKDYRFTNTYLSSNSKIVLLSRQNAYYNSFYNNDIVIVHEVDDDWQNDFVYPLSMSTGKPLSTIKYKFEKRNNIFFNRNELSFIYLYLTKDRDKTFVLLYDGTIVPASKFEAESDQLIPQHSPQLP